ncbi:MAG: phosphoribosylformylglycinamidine synthase subunit PurS [Bacteroidota bacterium]
MYLAKIRVTLRQSILDSQGKAVEHGINALGFDKVKSVRIGKYIEMHVQVNDREEAEHIADGACKKLLANPVMEDYSFSVEEVPEAKEA